MCYLSNVLGMDREEEKALFQYFRLPFYESIPTDTLLVAIMCELKAMAERLERIEKLVGARELRG